MAGTRRARTRAGAAVLAAGSVLLLGAGPAAAAKDPADSLTPLLECVLANDDGTWTAVLGYDNPTRSVISVPKGSDNQVTPASLGATPPTRFEPGVHRAVFSVVVDRGAGLMWHLGDDQFKVRRDSGKACPPRTEMPADGNGTGMAMVLGAAGVFGVIALRRARRRPEPAGPGA